MKKSGGAGSSGGGTVVKKGRGKTNGMDDERMGQDLVKFVDEAHNQLVKKMTVEMRKSTYFNCLLIMDDMVS